MESLKTKLTNEILRIEIDIRRVPEEVAIRCRKLEEVVHPGKSEIRKTMAGTQAIGFGRAIAQACKTAQKPMTAGCRSSLPFPSSLTVHLIQNLKALLILHRRAVEGALQHISTKYSNTKENVPKRASHQSHSSISQRRHLRAILAQLARGQLVADRTAGGLAEDFLCFLHLC